VVHFAQENGYYPYGTQRLLLYRETSPQAFPGPTGDYHAFKVWHRINLQSFICSPSNVHLTPSSWAGRGETAQSKRTSHRHQLERHFICQGGGL